MRTKVAVLLASMGSAVAGASDLPTSEKTVEVNVPAGETLTVSNLADYFSGEVSAGSNHYFNKTGEGTLVLSGNVQFLNMNISNGVVRVARTDNAEALRYVFVSEGASLVFDQDDPMRDYGVIVAWGTVDVNGHKDTFSTLTLVPPGRIINSSDVKPTITLNSDFASGETFDQLKVKVTKAGNGGTVTELDEFEPTYDGVPLLGHSATGGGFVISGAPQTTLRWCQLCDKRMSSAVIDWNLSTEALFELGTPYWVDGYRMAARSNNGKPTDPSPVSWEVYARVGGEHWGLVDKRDDVPFSDTFYDKAYYLGKNFTFSRKTSVADNVTIVSAGSLYGQTKRSDAFGTMTFDSNRVSQKTEITAGRTAVIGSDSGVYEAKWVRVRPTSTTDVKNNWYDFGYNWSMKSFQLVDEDSNAFYANTADTVARHETMGMKAFTEGSRSLVGHAVPEAAGSDYRVIQPVVLGFNGATKRIKGYQWKASTNENDTNRKPTGLVIEVSTDDKAWNAADKEWRLVDVCGYEIPSDDTGARDPRTFPSQLYRARYFRFEVCETLTHDDQYVQFAELNLYRNGTRVDWPKGTTATTKSSDVRSNLIVDNVRTLDDKESRDQRVIQSMLPYVVEIDAGETLSFDAFGYTSTGGGYFNRMPKSWRLMTRDSTSEGWRTAQVHSGTADEFVQANYTDQGPWTTWGYDVIGDTEAVDINAGATLELNTAFEKFGTLNGAGTLQLDDTRAEIGAAGGDFAGKVTGSGTLVVSADQNFTDADLSGVSTLELAAGTMTGSASFGGKPLAIAFTGGVLDATLSNLGKVTVSGTVKIALPSAEEIAAKRYRKTLVTAAELDTAVQAAFQNATFVHPGDMRGIQVTVRTTDTLVEVSAYKRGFAIIFR